MKKIMLVAAFGAIVSLQSSGDYMKWMVDPNSISGATLDNVYENIQDGNANVALANMKSYKYAALVASDSNIHDPYTALYSSTTAKENYVGTSGDDTGGHKVLQSSVFADGATIAAANIGTDYAGKYFFIELFDAAGQLVGYSEAISGTALNNELRDYKDTSRFAAEWSNLSAWNGGTFTAVPEPTGGLMILLGVGLIGLRRKKFI